MAHSGSLPSARTLVAHHAGPPACASVSPGRYGEGYWRPQPAARRGPTTGGTSGSPVSRQTRGKSSLRSFLSPGVQVNGENQPPLDCPEKLPYPSAPQTEDTGTDPAKLAPGQHPAEGSQGTIPLSQELRYRSRKRPSPTERTCTVPGHQRMCQASPGPQHSLSPFSPELHKLL